MTTTFLWFRARNKPVSVQDSYMQVIPIKNRLCIVENLHEYVVSRAIVIIVFVQDYFYFKNGSCTAGFLRKSTESFYFKF